MENRRLAESGTEFKRQLQEYDGRMYVVITEKRWASDGQGSKWEKTKSELCPYIPLGPGQAHVLLERWGEIYYGYVGRIEYFEKWTERYVDGGWEKRANKWEANLDRNGHGVKREETWFEGTDGRRLNETWETNI